MSEQQSDEPPYLVLARKYRPSDFSGVVGQDAMIRTLRNAFKSNRVHHAFILTGVRGVGKTTTARILARAFNYADKGGARPTLDLSEEGEHCRAIIEGRHVDVVEMDAASNTGVDNIRDAIIESVKYGPVSAPYKVFIIDEVHMLSSNAFNALLKTLEEPPPYVKFIFATTEIRKVPVTILSRCQRFDLRRISADVMGTYLEGLLAAEKLSAEPEALTMIIRAGEGSARDCLSLLDQAISYGDGKITGEAVREMLGLTDRSRLLDLFDMLMKGDIAQALELVRNLYDSGADPENILVDLAEVTHLVTRLKIVPAAADDRALTPDERARGAEFAGNLGMRVLTRTWQILTGGLGDVARAPDAIEALEMVLVRLVYAADLPTPDELIAKLSDSAPKAGHTPAHLPPSSNGGGQTGHRATTGQTAPQLVSRDDGPVASAQMQQTPGPAQPQSFQDVVTLASQKRDLVVKHALESDVHVISFADGRIEVALAEAADPSIIATLSSRLKAWTGRNWMVTVSNAADKSPTIRQAREAATAEQMSAAHEDPLVKAVMDIFPGAKLVNVKVRDDQGEDLPAFDGDTEQEEED